jgi:hypothetical protein
VLYFSHDYYSRVTDKNEQLVKASELAKIYKVKKFIAVTPLEFVNFHTNSIVDDPIKELNEAHDKVL